MHCRDSTPSSEHGKLSDVAALSTPTAAINKKTPTILNQIDYTSPKKKILKNGCTTESVKKLHYEEDVAYYNLDWERGNKGELQKGRTCFDQGTVQLILNRLWRM